MRADRDTRCLVPPLWELLSSGGSLVWADASRLGRERETGPLGDTGRPGIWGSWAPCGPFRADMIVLVILSGLWVTVASSTANRDQPPGQGDSESMVRVVVVVSSVPASLSVGLLPLARALAKEGVRHAGCVLRVRVGPGARDSPI